MATIEPKSKNNLYGKHSHSIAYKSDLFSFLKPFLIKKELLDYTSS